MKLVVTLHNSQFFGMGINYGVKERLCPWFWFHCNDKILSRLLLCNAVYRTICDWAYSKMIIKKVTEPVRPILWIFMAFERLFLLPDDFNMDACKTSSQLQSADLWVSGLIVLALKGLLYTHLQFQGSPCLGHPLILLLCILWPIPSVWCWWD